MTRNVLWIGVAVAAPGLLLFLWKSVALGLPLRYRGEMSSVRFDTDPAGAVVADASGPVVIHRIVLP